MQDGVRVNPYFKPGFDPFLTADPAYMPILVVDFNFLSAVLPLGQYISVHSLMLECVKKSNSGERIPEILGHLLAPPRAWQEVKDQYAASTNLVVDLTNPNSRYPELYPEMEDIEFSIVIPIRDKLDLLKSCLASFLRYPTNDNIEIIIVDNQSIEEETISWLGEQEKIRAIKVVKLSLIHI